MGSRINSNIHQRVDTSPIYNYLIMDNQRKRRGNHFFRRIKNDYGDEVISCMKTFSHYKVQLVTKFNQRILLWRCRKERILPQHLQHIASLATVFDNSNITSIHSLVINKFQFSTLNLEIKDICFKIHRLETDLNFVIQKIMTILLENIHHQFFNFEANKTQKILHRKKTVVNRNLNVSKKQRKTI